MARKITRLDLDALRECKAINILTESEIRQYVAGTNVVINVCIVGCGPNSTLSTFSVSVYGGDSTSSYPTLSGYMLQPATSPLLSTTEGSDTAIPCGSYNVQGTYGGNYKWEITDVEGRSGIKIHMGEHHGHTTGCFIPGNSYQMTNGDYSVYGAGTTFNALDSILEQYGGGGIQINIVGYR